MKIIIIIGIFILLLILGFARCSTSKKQEVYLLKIIESGAFMVDVRSPQEFAEGHVAGSVNIPLNQIEDRLDEFEGKKYILVCCRSGRRSGEAKALLEKHKIRNVVNGGSWANIRKLVEKNDK